MYACVREPITIPKDALVGMDPPDERSAQRTIRAELSVRRDLVEPIYYHKRSDNAAIGR